MRALSGSPAVIVREVPADPLVVAARLSPPAVLLDASHGLASPLVARACSLWPELAGHYPHAAAPPEGLWVWRTPRGGWVGLWDALLPPVAAADALALWCALESHPVRVAVQVPAQVARVPLLLALRAASLPLHLLACLGEDASR